MSNIENKIQSFVSGEPGSTGREVFEDSTATGPPEHLRENNGRAHGTAGGAVGVGSEAREFLQGQSGHQGLEGHRHEGHHHEGHHHENHGQQGLSGVLGQGHSDNRTGITPSHQSNIGDSYGSNPIGNTGRDHDLKERAALSGRTGNDGPISGGAAGTDRFDTDRGVDRTGATGNSFGARDDYPVHDTDERAHNKSSGGIAGVLATSDKDFTGRDRTGGPGGAYANIEGNNAGPGGNTALTGREGNRENNPVAQAEHTGVGHSGTAPHGSQTVGENEKPGLLEKVKHAVGLDK